jgi:hypothetical protein
MNHPYDLQQELDDTKSAFVDLMKSRMDWCVDTERYEMAARLRDLIEYQTTEDEAVKDAYFVKLCKKYSPELYESIKHKYEK